MFVAPLKNFERNSQPPASFAKPMAKLAMQQLSSLRGCEMHSSVMLSSVDENTLRRLGINLTCEPKHQTQRLYHG